MAAGHRQQLRRGHRSPASPRRGAAEPSWCAGRHTAKSSPRTAAPRRHSVAERRKCPRRVAAQQSPSLSTQGAAPLPHREGRTRGEQEEAARGRRRREQRRRGGGGGLSAEKEGGGGGLGVGAPPAVASACVRVRPLVLSVSDGGAPRAYHPRCLQCPTCRLHSTAHTSCGLETGTAAAALGS